MRAIVMGSYGSPSVLQPADVPAPPERAGWVTVRLAASALNWHDVLVRQGRYSSPLPHIPGADGAGVRIDTNEAVVVLPSLFWGRGDAAPGADWEILGDHHSGTYAELVTVPAECAVPRPRGLSLAQAAALPLVGLTTFRALFSRGRLRSGESLLVLGASGGVATTAVALATAAGARAIVTSGATRKIDAARELGAAGGVDHTESDWVEAARALTPRGAGFDLVLDSVGRWAESVRCLAPGGRCVVLGASAGEQATLPVRPFYFGQYELIGTTMGSPRDMAGLLRFLDDHTVAPPVIDRTFPLAQAALAHERLEAGTGIGKIVLTHD
ncbi:NADPH:quinone reductase [Parafrankia irregularis]|uniref:NADPH:quinone reductase n=1 Tax=Parafrankia irregularis TaxID=795642 RepID=A0A0S4QXD7_9ACTN|nr:MULTISPECIES: zinc-binding dehydrogenase [Parafrankia]MBE3200308.1 zinc-binding dehydrogenase [Parafrankia sp. CH37]CUU59714.1 NADPH:quinone reductase [Parafrankia irregularis]